VTTANRVQCADTKAGAPSTSRATRRIEAISWVTVSCRATASSSTVESNARRVLPARTPVEVMTSRTTSKIRCGRSLAASRRRQYVNVEGWNPDASTAYPHAAFQRRSNVSASTASRSEYACSDCNTNTEAMTSGGTEGRPRPDGNKSVNSSGGNNASRCSAKNANTLPAGNRCPANDDPSSRTSNAQRHADCSAVS
jgi:hypothetical protein